MFVIAAVATFVAAIVADVYDVRMTESGLKKGLAVEGFDWLVGTKPTTIRLYARDIGVIVASTAPAVLMQVLHAYSGASFGALLLPGVVAIKHILGGKAWKKLGA